MWQDLEVNATCLNQKARTFSGIFLKSFHKCHETILRMPGRSPYDGDHHRRFLNNLRRDLPFALQLGDASPQTLDLVLGGHAENSALNS